MNDSDSETAREIARLREQVDAANRANQDSGSANGCIIFLLIIIALPIIPGILFWLLALLWSILPH